MSVFQTFWRTIRPAQDLGAQVNMDRAWAATHRHRKGGLYRVICRGVLEADHSDVVIYDDESGKVWVRPAVEFDDGRFSIK